MSASSPDVVIVGGGIVGTSAAAFLAGAGARVTLVERDGLASGASGANSGLVQHPFDPALVPLYRDTVALYRELSSADAGFELAAEPAGMLFVSTRQQAARRQTTMIASTFPELAPEFLGGPALQRVEPALGADLWACRVTIGYPVVPAASTYAYATLAEARGVTVRLGRAAALQSVGDTVVGVRMDGRLLTAGAVLVAAGPWTPALLDPSGGWMPIRPRWGVVVDVELAAPPRFALEEAGIDAVIGVPPAGDHGVKPGTGPSSEDVDFSLIAHAEASGVGSTFLDREPELDAWIEPILTRAMRYVPRVADAPIRGVRACARPQSADGRPLIGRVAGRRRLFVCAGHGPWGISTGPGSARLVADLILGRAPAIPPAFDPARFGAPQG